MFWLKRQQIERNNAKIKMKEDRKKSFTSSLQYVVSLHNYFLESGQENKADHLETLIRNLEGSISILFTENTDERKI